ncbi:MAG TPA: hypothetical protein VGE52_16770 [Pirellulales bacterium]
MTGKVMCSGKPVSGTLLFSPAGNTPESKGEPVSVILNPDGTYTATLKTSGAHRLLVMPSDVKYPAPPGKEYPCDLSPITKTLTVGANEVDIDLPAPK